MICFILPFRNLKISYKIKAKTIMIPSGLIMFPKLISMAASI